MSLTTWLGALAVWALLGWSLRIAVLAALFLAMARRAPCMTCYSARAKEEIGSAVLSAAYQVLPAAWLDATLYEVAIGRRWTIGVAVAVVEHAMWPIMVPALALEVHGMLLAAGTAPCQCEVVGVPWDGEIDADFEDVDVDEQGERR